MHKKFVKKPELVYIMAKNDYKYNINLKYLSEYINMSIISITITVMIIIMVNNLQ